MNLVELLRSRADLVVDEADAALGRCHLDHYEQAGPQASRERLASLFGLIVHSLDRRDLVPMIDYADAVAQERFRAGFGIEEVQVAFNVLEEATWRQIVNAVPASELAEAIGLVSTVLGVGKDTLARTYVSLASKQHVQSLDLSALFRGSAAQ